MRGSRTGIYRGACYWALSAFLLVLHPSTQRIEASGTKPAGRVPLRTFGLRHYETTGITTYLVDGGREIPIQFSPRSNEIALRELRALKWNVFLPNGNGKRLFVIGSLSPLVQNTPGGPYRAQSEPYQEFTLQQWHLLIPFVEWREKSPGEALHPYKRHHLQWSDFEKT